MTSLQILDLALKILTFIGVIFAVYHFFKKPQEKSEIVDAVFDTKFCNLEKTVINLRDNHLHTLETKLDQHIAQNQMYMLETTKTTTRIETLLEQLLKK